MLNWVGIVFAGLLNGSFAVPLKTTRTWKFDHIWMIHSLLAMCLVPWGFAIAVVPGWTRILAAVPASGWLGLMGWGVLFGIGSLLYGIAVDLLGIALGFSIQLGLSIVLGALLPLIWAGTLSLRTRQDRLLLVGLAVMVAGVILCAQAGGSRSATRGTGGGRFRRGMIIAIIGGILAPTLNFGIQYGTSLLAPLGGTLASGEFPARTYLAWAVFLSAAAVIQAGTCLIRILRNKQAGVFRASGAGRDLLQVVAMGLLWISSVFAYGRGAFGLGPRGPSFGWPVFVALIILTSNAWGVALGEWRQASPRAFHRMLAGSAVLVLAAFLIGQGSGRG
jgi:L-rhamnose-H+ transport protein